MAWTNSYPEYLTYSANFKKRYCVDLSKKALDVAKKNWGTWRIFSEIFENEFRIISLTAL